MSHSASKTSAFAVGNVVDIARYSYAGHGVILEFDYGPLEELATVRFENGQEDQFDLSQLTFVAAKTDKIPDKKSRDTELRVRDRVRTIYGKFGIIIDFQDNACADEYAEVLLDDNNASTFYNVTIGYVTLAVAAER